MIRGEVVAIRHGETDWSRTGRHTSVTDLPLTEAGRVAAQKLTPVLAEIQFARVFSSPMQRAKRTCEIAGLGDRMEIETDLAEWNYGDYEGLTQDEIERRAPGWQLFTDGCPGGENPQQVATRIGRLIAKLRSIDGNVAVFAHGHILRVLGARWINQLVSAGANLLLEPTTLCVLGYYRQVPAIARWNAKVV
ncbi:MAG: histidine phosphatase family protein [Kofleriaceae bacterium]|nr:histidine phosphatase family protein [Kofleriaceae bacterium]